jgi:hypothetical protein
MLSLGHRVDWDLLFLRQPTVEDLEDLVVAPPGWSPITEEGVGLPDGDESRW